ncbi:uncharacterized protein B0H64DRAFT_463078 [Chaetomium fimeti]|uniref:Mid2 domain-containing protein n=1 Tax=Chaetomium fimeti TaxID=1854472 RepID=A0AAE0LQP6_9PEZI|nr:hypothetical protein B0H64DRAFT_463078 [Chaetomium fimeti]
MRLDMFDSLPQPTALLLLSSLVQLTDAHAFHKLPRQTPEPTITLPHHVLNVVSWPIQPTPPPGADLFAYRRRQLDDSFNTICGYVNGDLELPATCGSGSHCVVDTEHNVVGCCPNGAPSCTAGVFTGCVDGNSGAQTEVNPYVFSCTGAAVCYMNEFEGGFSQYGCGTASDMAATVQNSASGITAILNRPTVSVSYTEGISILSEPTTLGTPSSRASTASARSSASPASASDSTASPTATENSDAAAPPATDTGPRTGAIVGGTIGGLAVVIALVALVFFFLRRRNANVRQGPGPGGFRGKVISPPQPGGGTGFAALANDDTDAFETGPAGSVLDQQQQQHQQYQQQYHPQQPQMSTNPAATTSAAAAAAAAAGAAASAPPGTANRSMLPPLATAPPMPFQSEVSPVEHHDLDTPLAYSHSAISGVAGGAGLSSAGAASAASSSYPPSSSGGLSGGDGQQNLANNVPAANGAGMGGMGQQQQQGYGYGPAAYAGGSGLMMGMSPLLLNRGAERHLESDQVPLTGAAAGGQGGGGGGGGVGGVREMDDFSQGFHAALGRIGEEDEEDEEGRRLSRLQQQQQQQQSQYQQQQGGYQDVVGGGGGGADEGGTVGSEGSGQGRPLWQQNRRQSRNLMWM